MSRRETSSRPHRAIPKYGSDPLVPIGALHLRVVMRRRGMTSKEVASQAGISQQRFWSLKSGKIKKCRRSVRAALAKALGCRVGDLSGTSGLESFFIGGATRSEPTDRRELLDALATQARGPEVVSDPWMLTAVGTALQLAELADTTANPVLADGLSSAKSFLDSMIQLLNLETWRAHLSSSASFAPPTPDEKERFAAALADALELAVGTNSPRPNTTATSARRLRDLLPSVAERLRQSRAPSSGAARLLEVATLRHRGC
jgi:DNA-binding Xre family transcriptional regulator